MNIPRLVAASNPHNVIFTFRMDRKLILSFTGKYPQEHKKVQSWSNDSYHVRGLLDAEDKLVEVIIAKNDKQRPDAPLDIDAIKEMLLPTEIEGIDGRSIMMPS